MAQYEAEQRSLSVETANYDSRIEQTIRDSDAELEEIFRSNFSNLYETVTTSTKLPPQQFFQGSDQNGDRKITPDEFDNYMDKLPAIVQDMKGGNK